MPRQKKEQVPNTTMKSFKYRIYPNKEVTAKLEWRLNVCRMLYNASVGEHAKSRVWPVVLNEDGSIDESKNPSKMADSFALHSEKRWQVWQEEGKAIVKMAQSDSAICTPIKILEDAVYAKSINKCGQSRVLTQVKRHIYPQFQEIGDHVLRDVLERVDFAFQDF